MRKVLSLLFLFVLSAPVFAAEDAPLDLMGELLSATHTRCQSPQCDIEKKTIICGVDSAGESYCGFADDYGNRKTVEGKSARRLIDAVALKLPFKPKCKSGSSDCTYPVIDDIKCSTQGCKVTLAGKDHHVKTAKGLKSPKQHLFKDKHN